VHAYVVYGLSLLSDVPIPELLPHPAFTPGEGHADVSVEHGAIPKHWDTPPPLAVEAGGPEDQRSGAGEPSDSWSERRADVNETLSVFAGVGRYLIRAGHSITIEADPTADAAFVRHLLLGPVLAHLLWQRDIFTLHASVVEIGAQYAGFVGVSGEGKSTTAAALEAHGHTLVCDDVAALSERDGRLHVLPAFPRIRLYDDSVRGVGEDPERMPWVHPHYDKRSKGVRRFAASPVPLHRLYVLDTGDDFDLARLSPGKAVMELVRHTYLAHQYAPLYGFKHQLERASEIARQVGVYRLTRPKDLARLPELVRLLEQSAVP
jgi:hypothetical protein